jgi:hypothetical protein
MATYKKWNDSEISFIKDNHLSMPDETIAVKLSQITGQNISTAMVRRQRRKLTLKKPRGRPCKNKPIESSGESVTV